MKQLDCIQFIVIDLFCGAGGTTTGFEKAFHVDGSKKIAKVQGFPEQYILLGNQTDQKKFIGNAVHPYVPEHWIIAFSNRLAA